MAGERGDVPGCAGAGFPRRVPGDEHLLSARCAVLDFAIEVAPDVFVSGTAAMPAPDYAHVSVIDVTAHAAALFARWLRDSYVPSPAGVRFLALVLDPAAAPAEAAQAVAR
ncbi:hypothetical protein ACIHAR_05210 [Streptomyces sp. NPDC052016]|uniref:hypothetical protein n=1 Tax=Streptomyces sp. NPDC052016 TaxID=3365680 RepID=UPI0037D7FBFF